MTVYQNLGIRPLINAMGTVTIYGGSLMPESVVQAMAEAARSYVSLRDLQDQAGARIAELAGVEAALVCSGAAGGITLATAAALTGADWESIHRLPDVAGLRNEVVVLKSERPNYMYQAAEHVGAKLVHVGSSERATPEDFAAAIGPMTAAVLLVVATLDHLRARSAEMTVTIEGVAAVARQAGVPVLVDAAAELPPTSNLRAFLEMGADVAIFSGGKGIRGPQASGLLVGRKDLVQAAAMNNNPYSAIGRPMKVGKEEIAGLVRAVELFVGRDEEAELQEWRARASRIAESIENVPGLRPVVTTDGLYARPPITPICLVHVDETALGISADELSRQLLEGDPAVAVGRFPGGLVCNPMTLEEGEEIAVARQICRLLGR